MAVTVTTTPNDYQPIGNRFEFGFSIDSSGNGGDLAHSIGYELYDEDDTLITEIEQIPYSANEQFADFENDIKPAIYTTLQDPGSTIALTQDANFSKGYYVTYGQIETDTSACTTEVTGVNNDSSEFMALNCAFDLHEDYAAFASGDMTILSDRPTENYVTSDQDIFVHIFRDVSSNIFVFRENFDRDGNQIGSAVLNSTASSGAHIYAMSAFPGTYSGIHSWSIYISTQVSGTPIIKQYNFYLLQCGEAPIKELHWIEPKGSQSSLVFENVVMAGNQAAGSNFEQYIPSGLTNTQRGKGYGLSRSNVRGLKRVTMSRIMDYVPGLDRWIDGMFSSSQHYVKYRLANGTYILSKFVLDDGNWESYNENQLIVTVSGTIHIPINAL